MRNAILRNHLNCILFLFYSVHFCCRFYLESWDGTSRRVGLPVVLSYRVHHYPGNKWYVDLPARLTALAIGGIGVKGIGK